MDSITINLPLPSKHLSPNARVHWAVKAKAAAKARADARTVAKFMVVKPPMWKAVTVRCQFTFRDKRSRDRDNLLASAKNYFDGIADAGIVANDSGMTHLPIEIMPPNRETAGVVITIHPTPTEAK